MESFKEGLRSQTRTKGKWEAELLCSLSKEVVGSTFLHTKVLSCASVVVTVVLDEQFVLGGLPYKS